MLVGFISLWSNIWSQMEFHWSWVQRTKSKAMGFIDSMLVMSHSIMTVEECSISHWTFGGQWAETGRVQGEKYNSPAIPHILASTNFKFCIHVCKLTFFFKTKDFERGTLQLVWVTISLSLEPCAVESTASWQSASELKTEVKGETSALWRRKCLALGTEETVLRNDS